MNKENEELMQKNIIGENRELNKMIADIVPLKENKFTNIEIEAEKKQEFSLVLYKKENVLIRAFKGIKFTFEKLRIMRHSNEFVLEKVKNK